MSLLTANGKVISEFYSDNYEDDMWKNVNDILQDIEDILRKHQLQDAHFILGELRETADWYGEYRRKLDAEGKTFSPFDIFKEPKSFNSFPDDEYGPYGRKPYNAYPASVKGALEDVFVGRSFGETNSKVFTALNKWITHHNNAISKSWNNPQDQRTAIIFTDSWEPKNFEKRKAAFHDAIKNINLTLIVILITEYGAVEIPICPRKWYSDIKKHKCIIY